jgi:hypothetical protein
MESLVKRGLLPMRTEVLEWVIPSHEEVLAPLDSYVVSFTPFHERRLVALPIDFSEGAYIITRSSCST